MEGKPAEFADCDGNSQLNNLFVVEKIQKITTTIRLQRHFNKEENGGSSSATARRRRQRKNKRLEVADMKEKLCAGNPLEGDFLK
uniref:Uncharacterized protein n=1 Tax=Meloidogyne hapla TaxID=6305 RepID=A0A1I8AY52_MELHA